MLAELQSILPYAHARAALYIVPLNAAMTAYDINTKGRQAAFIAQIGHESGQFRYVKEIASGVAYEMLRDLGNIEPGDGVKYKGRGLIQITGRANYAAVGDALNLDALGQPELLEQPEAAARSAGWFWTTGAGLRLSRAAKARLGDLTNLNDVADKGDFVGITLAINGGTNGLASRQAYYERAQAVLGS